MGGRINARAVRLHPIPHARQALLDRLREFAAGHGADIEQEIPAFARDVNQLARQIFNRFPIRVVLSVAPGIVDGHAGFPQPTPGQGAGGNVLLWRGIVFGELIAVVDDDLGLERADIGVDLGGVNLLGRVLPAAVPPEDADRTVFSQEVAELPLHILDVTVEARAVHGARVPLAARQVVRVMPVHDGVVETQAQALAPAFGRQVLHRIVMPRRCLDDVVVGHLRIEHRKAVVVLAGDDDVFHPRVFRRLNPLARVELNGVELGGEFLVVGHLHLLVREVPLRDALVALEVGRVGGHGVDAPVDEHPELRLAPPLRPRLELLRGLVRGLGRRRREKKKEGQSPSKRNPAHDSSP